MAPRDPARGASNDAPAQPDPARGVPIAGSRLKRARKDRGWTQPDAARNIGVAYRTYQKWEKGERANIANVTKILRAYDDLSVEDVVLNGFVPAGDVRPVDERLDALEASIGELVRRVGALDRKLDRILRALRAAPATGAQPIVPYPESELPAGADRRGTQADRREPGTRRRTGSDG